MWLNQFSGCFALMHYTANIFKDSGSILNPKESSIIVAVICLLGSYASTYLVDRCGRKVLMVASTSLSSLGYISIATYSYLKFVRFDVSSFKWVPIASLSLVIFVGSLGILSLPFIILPEIVPQKVSFENKLSYYS
jgi:MFS family permease